MRAAGVVAGLALVGGVCVVLSRSSGHRDLAQPTRTTLPTVSTTTAVTVPAPTTTTRPQWRRSDMGGLCEVANLPADGSPLPHVTRETPATGPPFRGFAKSVARFHILGGWELSQRPDLDVHVSATGLVVMVLDTSVVRSADDYRAFRVNPDGVGRLVRLAEEMELDPFDGRSGRVGPQEVALDVSTDAVSPDRANIGPTLVAQRPPRRCVPLSPDEVAAAILDLGWLGDDIETPVGPWIPKTMRFTVRAHPRPNSGHLSTDPWAPWPLDRSIEELLGDAPANREGERYLFLDGDDVPKVFALLDGANHTALWVDDGTKYELDVDEFGP